MKKKLPKKVILQILRENYECAEKYTSGYERELLPGMLISIERGIYIPRAWGFRHSDTILVTDDGCVSMTEAPERLKDLIL